MSGCYDDFWTSDYTESETGRQEKDASDADASPENDHDAGGDTDGGPDCDFSGWPGNCVPIHPENPRAGMERANYWSRAPSAPPDRGHQGTEQ